MNSSGVLYHRLQGLDPEYFSTVMDYILQQHPTDHEWLTLASSSDAYLLNLIQERKSYLDLVSSSASSSNVNNANPFSRSSSTGFHFSTTPETPLSSYGSSSGSPSSASQKMPCIYFAKGFCMKGSKCSFSHSELDFNKTHGEDRNGRRVGKLVISSKEIAKGSNGTIVFEGTYEDRSAAVKRLVLAHYDVADKEFKNLIVSDHHPNIVRLYGVEYDQDFVYLSLERCICSFDDLIQICIKVSQNDLFPDEQSSTAMTEYHMRLNSLKSSVQEIKLWKANGYPSPLLLTLMRDVVSGLAHLHKLGIVHRDVKPPNILIRREGSFCAKLSDMGISKRLHGDKSSLGDHATGCGSSGWQAPEQLLQGRQTRALDMFSFGCVLFFCITGGKHPFGDRLERDINIVKNEVKNFSLVDHIPEAAHLISQLLNHKPEMRPKASEVLSHPLFWDSETRMSFLRDTSDKLLVESRNPNSVLVAAMESISPSVLVGQKWYKKMELPVINNLGRYRRYNFESIKDLLRVIRNKLNHYGELPLNIQKLLGPVPEGFDSYFATRYPKLLIEVYKVVHRLSRDEMCFQKYFKGHPL